MRYPVAVDTAGHEVKVLTLRCVHVTVLDMTVQTEQAFVPHDSLANRLLLIRSELGLSQREAADACSVGYGSWQSWENGAAPRDAVRQLTRVADRLGIDRDWLMFGGTLRPETDNTGDGGLPRVDSNHQHPGWLTGSSGRIPSTELSTLTKSVPELRQLIRRGPIGLSSTQDEAVS